MGFVNPVDPIFHIRKLSLWQLTSFEGGVIVHNIRSALRHARSLCCNPSGARKITPRAPISNSVACFHILGCLGDIRRVLTIHMRSAEWQVDDIASKSDASVCHHTYHHYHYLSQLAEYPSLIWT